MYYSIVNAYGEVFEYSLGELKDAYTWYVLSYSPEHLEALADDEEEAFSMYQEENRYYLINDKNQIVIIDNDGREVILGDFIPIQKP